MGGGLTEARAAAGLARAIGYPLTPHQQVIIDTAAARDGVAYTHPRLLVLAPRQVAKTTTTLLVMLARMMTRRGYAAAYTAQTGIVVTHVMTNPGNGWMTLADQYLGQLFATSRSQGREIIRTRAHNPGAYLKAFPPTPGRLRSNSLDAVVLDEGQEHGHETGNALLADTGPVFTTRPRRQLWVMGTAGHADSWFQAQYLRARAGDYQLVEIGTWPEDADIEDPAVWREHHPGLRAGMTDVDHLRGQLALLGPDLFAREYGNRWGAAAGTDHPIPAEAWQAAQWDADPPAAPAAVAFHASADGSRGVIVAAGRIDGRTVAGIVDTRPGVAWLASAVAGIAERHPAAAITADPGSTAGGAFHALSSAGRTVSAHIGAQRTAAPAHLASLIASGDAAVLPHPAMDAAHAAAGRKATENGGWKWTAAEPGADIAPMQALTMAVWAASRPAAPKPRAIAAPVR